jgi:hypothetical protein
MDATSLAGGLRALLGADPAGSGLEVEVLPQDPENGSFLMVATRRHSSVSGRFRLQLANGRAGPIRVVGGQLALTRRRWRFWRRTITASRLVAEPAGVEIDVSLPPRQGAVVVDVRTQGSPRAAPHADWAELWLLLDLAEPAGRYEKKLGTFKAPPPDPERP